MEVAAQLVTHKMMQLDHRPLHRQSVLRLILTLQNFHRRLFFVQIRHRFPKYIHTRVLTSSSSRVHPCHHRQIVVPPHRPHQRRLQRPRPVVIQDQMMTGCEMMTVILIMILIRCSKLPMALRKVIQRRCDFCEKSHTNLTLMNI